MLLDRYPDVRKLSAAEKLIFVGELWDDLAKHPSDVPASRDIAEELDRRMEHFRRHPEEFTTWEAIQQKMLGKKL
jgi:putative addiction module component (TIGR02574 family)